MSDTQTNKPPPFLQFDTSSIDRLLAHIDDFATTPARRNAILDELLRISNSRQGLMRAFVITKRDVGAEHCIFKIRPSGEFLERIERELQFIKSREANEAG